MKKSFLFITIFVSQVVIGIPDQELFLQGNQRFFDGKFDKARNCYEQIPHKSSAVWHNIGNCHYNEENGAKALVCWRRAQLGAGFYELGQLLESERIALEKYNCPCDGIFIRGVKRVILSLPKFLMQLLLTIYFILLLTLCYQCLIKNRKKYRLIPCKKQYLFLLIFAIVVLLLLIAAKDKFTKEQQGVIVHQKVSVHVGPETSFHKKTALPLGCIVQVIDEQKGMVKITCSQGSGWITHDNVEIV